MPRGHANTPEAEAERRRKIRESSRGRKPGPPSEETRRKISETLTGRKQTPERRNAARTAMLANREQIAATSAAAWERRRAETGEVLGYYGCHRRVRKARGRAGDLTCTECSKQAKHWAHIHGTDPTDPQNYQAMCQKCHWAYDAVGAKTAAAKGPEGHHAVAVKAWETKRRKQGERDASPDSARPGYR